MLRKWVMLSPSIAGISREVFVRVELGVIGRETSPQELGMTKTLRSHTDFSRALFD
jgi:hypothetical protein